MLRMTNQPAVRPCADPYALLPGRSFGRGARGPASIQVRLGSALMTEALTGLLESRGWRCSADAGGPDVVIVDAATVGTHGKQSPSRVLFLHLGDARREAALLSWHGAHAVIPVTCCVAGLEKILSAPAARTRAREQRPAPFTPQERRVVRGICRGETTKEIAGTLGISVHTVKVYVHAIRTKTGAASRGQLITALAACAGGEEHGD